MYVIIIRRTANVKKSCAKSTALLCVYVKTVLLQTVSRHAFQERSYDKRKRVTRMHNTRKNKIFSSLFRACDLFSFINWTKCFGRNIVCTIDTCMDCAHQHSCRQYNVRAVVIFFYIIFHEEHCFYRDSGLSLRTLHGTIEYYKSFFVHHSTFISGE